MLELLEVERVRGVYSQFSAVEERERAKDRTDLLALPPAQALPKTPIVYGGQAYETLGFLRELVPLVSMLYAFQGLAVPRRETLRSLRYGVVATEDCDEMAPLRLEVNQIFEF